MCVASIRTITRIIYTGTLKRKTMQKAYRNNHIIFSSLILLTLLTWFMGQIEMNWKISFIILLTSAVIKIQLIGDFFMQLRTVAGFWRWIISLWAVITGGLITTAFFL